MAFLKMSVAPRPAINLNAGGFTASGSSLGVTYTPAPGPTVLYGDAPWNVPVSQVARLGASSEAARVQELLNQPQYNASTQGGWNLHQEDYTYPVYYASDATGNYVVNANNSESGLNGTAIPFNPAWQPAPGTDGQIIIYNEATGEEYNMHKYTGLDGSNRITASRVNRIQGPLGSPGTNSFADMRTREFGFRPSRGCGIQYLAMLITFEEIQNGLIPHALSMPTPNAAHSIASGGVYYGYTPDGYVPPATKAENFGGPSNNTPAKVVVEGTRYSLQKTDAQISAHVNSFPGDVPQSVRDGIRTILVAMRDYGWFITDQAGAISLQMQSYVSCDWASIGFRNTIYSNGKMYPRDGLDGILTQSDMRAYVPSNTSSPWY